MQYRMPEIEQAWRDTQEFLGEAEDFCYHTMSMEDVFACIGQPVRKMFERPNYC